MLSKSDGWRKHLFFSPTWPPGPAGPGSERGLTWGQVTCGPFLTDWELEPEEGLRSDCWSWTSNGQQIVAPPPRSHPQVLSLTVHWPLTPPWCFQGRLNCFLSSCLQFLWSSRRVFLVWLFVFTSCWEIKLQNDEKKLQKRLLNSTNDFIFWICKRCIF